MIKRPIRVIINFLRTRSFPSVYKGHDKHTHRPQHAIDSFHFKKKTRQFKQNLSWCYILLHPLLPEKKVPIPAASNSSPSILSCSPPQNPTHHCSAPPVNCRPHLASQTRTPGFRSCRWSSLLSLSRWFLLISPPPHVGVAQGRDLSHFISETRSPLEFSIMYPLMTPKFISPAGTSPLSSKLIASYSFGIFS